ncbi:glycosyltransferase family 4 protein [Tuberibacillus sp. Marseille-P3662]|uniref:glycosyltransferase family 4 protein n=1 Tax=Tuberibacillus sp. Marseille-P3662 TaxID=1965358 RepID=UPI000A1C7E2A|nr:glycosyltransferase family 4 protein [Tuberibacillus sp. Marseille-P3662]
MKVLVISHLYPTHFNPYAGAFVHEQVKELMYQGCEVVVISPVRYAPFPLNQLSRKWSAYAQTPYYLENEGVPIYHPRYISFPKNILFHQTGRFMYKGIYDTAKKLHKQYQFDLIHAHVALPDGVATMKLAHQLGLPFVLTIHGKDLLGTIHTNRSSKLQVKKAIQSAKQVVLVSDRLDTIRKQAFEDVIDEKCHVVPNGVSPIFLKEPMDQEKQKPSFSPILLSVSNLNPLKGIQYNIVAVSKLIKKYNNLHYYIVGKGESEQYLRDLVTEHQLQDHVTFLGAKSKEEVKQLMEQCDVFSMPSWNEAFGIVYIEAMACGKPIIGTRGEGVEEVVSNESNGFLVPPQDEDALATVIDKLFENEQLRRKVGGNAKELIEEKFTWKRNGEHMLKIYQRALES